MVERLTGQRFSLTYIPQGDPTNDSETMRYRLAKLCQSAFKTDPPQGEQSPQASGPHIAGSSVGFAFSGSGFCSRFALGEAERCVPGLDDSAVVRDAIKQGSRHLGVTEHRHPFAELEIRRDDETGGFIHLCR